MKAASNPPPFPAALDRTLRLSRYAARVAHARPGVIEAIEGRDARPFSRAEMAAMLQGEPQGLGSRLRRLRETVMVSLAHRDLNGLAPLDEVFGTMSALAETCVASASAEAQREAEETHGGPVRDRLVVAALGKLGGGELNVSSDIDLVFLHAGNGETPGPRAVSHHEFFSIAGRRLIALLAEPTAEGIAFRVDMRLRPFGDSGPLVASMAQLEDYFITQARPWERYAWLKARVIDGPAAGLDERIEPFVYRRYLDYGLLDALRELHARIFEAALQKRKTDDIKVGPGGIREIEFAVQLFQLVRGGRDAGLRMTSTRGALAALRERGLIEPARADALAAAYDFLRRLEHRLQYYDDQQTQALPRGDEHRALIAEAMDEPGWDALSEKLAHHRALVQEAFNALFEQGAGQAPPTTTPFAATLFDPQANPDPELLAEQLADAGIAAGSEVARRLIEYTRSRRFRAMSAGTRAKVERLLPALVAASAAQPEPATAMLRLLELVEAISGRESYFSLLLEFPQVLARAARLVSRSLWAARLLARHPILLDELTRSAASFAATDWKAERARLGAECEAMSADVERLLDHLRHYKQRQMLRFALADVEGELPVMALSDELSALADLLLDVTLAEAVASLGFARDAVPLAVVGFGKLGGKELGYASDLDIVFLYDEASGAPFESLARVAQRVITWMTTLTPAGVLYETDLRLRPDGAKGLLVSTVAAFRDYELKRAWTWEHQAITRARAAAGDRAVGARFEALREEVLSTPRDRAKLLGEILAMRQRMRHEHRRDAHEIKHVEGGIIDLEFCVQAVVLAHGPEHPALRENKGNHTLLKRAAEAGLLAPDIAIPAADAYLVLRQRAHEAALNDVEKVILAGDELAAERDAVKALWRAVFAP
ncbi:MAG TPA: bifunctional [glutamate--ammonia ligase]-adenylyl-L-tyrosine phosphorylase/[glutamate--ammonia-ligase] adenylyltransferase [Usitatibacter sp.]|nr:bifunctional [glutamate--ammonia ligase]-adenylyl-L-tyrosine phosphorylase/[glutamate--ammonia-ligase] adenylyltransferase [Usitatibacter sp.]